MVIYCQKCKRHFFSGMERCPHCGCEVQGVKWLKTASIIAFILALVIALAVMRKVEPSSFRNRMKPLPLPAPVPEDRQDIPIPLVNGASAFPQMGGDYFLRHTPPESVEVQRAAKVMS